MDSIVNLQAKQGDKQIQFIENAIEHLILAYRDGVARLTLTENQHEASNCIRRAIFLLVNEKLDKDRIMGKAARQVEIGQYQERIEGESDLPPLLE